MATISPSPELTSMAAFRASVPFGGGPERTAERLCAVGRYQALSRGKELAGNRDEDRLVYIAEGSAKLIALSGPAQAKNGDQGSGSAACDHVLAFHFEGDIVSVLRQSDTDFRLIALTDLELVIFPAKQFLDVAQDDPAVLRSVLTRSLEALHRSRTKMMQLGHKSARQRIADFLVTMAKRLTGRTDGPCEITLPMSRRDIADSLGLTIETVSRQFTELRDAGLVETEGRSCVRLTDIRQLATEAGNTASTTKSPQS